MKTVDLPLKSHASEPQAFAWPWKGRIRIPEATAVIALLMLAAAVRVRGALNDLWLDEIWSLRLVSHISGWTGVFTQIHHDNNHYLNSLWLYWAGERGDWWGYRLPAIGAGVGTIVVAWLIGRRRSAINGVFAVLLTSGSYVLVLYSTEARGYSTAVLFCLAAYCFMDVHLETRKWVFAVISSLSSIMALLSQLISASVVLALIVWCLHRYIRLRISPLRICLRLFALFSPVAAFVVLLYSVDIRHVVAGGGTPSSLVQVLSSALGWALGVSWSGLAAVIMPLAAFFVVGTGVWVLCRAKTDDWSFFIAVILVFPVLLLVVRRDPWIYVRHFIIGIAFLLILFSIVLTAVWEKGFAGKAVCVSIIALYLVANGCHTLELFRNGRGHYSEAVRFMAEHSQRPILTVGGDHDFRVGLTFEFYRAVAIDKNPIYFSRNHWPADGPEWIVVQNESYNAAVPKTQIISDSGGNHYAFAGAYPTAPLSGLQWVVFHNQSP